MRTVHTRLRIEIVAAALGRGRRFTPRHQQVAFARKRSQGWIANLPPTGPPFQQVSLIGVGHPLAPIVEAVKSGQDVFAAGGLGPHLGAHPFCKEGLKMLSLAGLAIVAADETHVRLRATDPRAARLVNLARKGLSKKGFLDETVIEAFLAVRHPSRSRCSISDDRRLCAAEILVDDWEIDCDDLLEGHRYVRLVSRWLLPPMLVAVSESEAA